MVGPRATEGDGEALTRLEVSDLLFDAREVGTPPFDHFAGESKEQKEDENEQRPARRPANRGLSVRFRSMDGVDMGDVDLAEADTGRPTWMLGARPGRPLSNDRAVIERS
ncbi:MAG: hypothetical protein ACRDON_11370 [Gaiellaceae bacterium]